MRRDETRQRGAALVEFALLLPLLLVLMLGVVSVGIAYNHQISLTHAAREASRFAATLPVSNFSSDPDPMAAWLAAVAAQAKEDAGGSLGPSVPGLLVCVAYVYPNGTLGSDSTTSLVEGAAVPVSTDPCFVDGRPATERRVQVAVQRETDFTLGFYSQMLTIGSDAVGRFEAAPGGG